MWIVGALNQGAYEGVELKELSPGMNGRGLNAFM